MNKPELASNEELTAWIDDLKAHNKNLLNYVDHRYYCSANSAKPCTCGLDELLEEGK